VYDLFESNELGDLELAFDYEEDRAFFPWANLTGGLKKEADQMFLKNKNVEACWPTPAWNLTVNPTTSRKTRLRNVFIWGHGARGHSDIYLEEDGTAPLTPASLATILILYGLPVATFSGNIVVWTCFGGQPAGCAALLHQELIARGALDTLRVWGFDGITGLMENHRFSVVDLAPQNIPTHPTSEQIAQWRSSGVVHNARMADLTCVGNSCPIEPAAQPSSSGGPSFQTV
jgi:hypothetical protein